MADIMSTLILIAVGCDQVTAATTAFIYTADLPRFPSAYQPPEGRDVDLFDFLHYVFGFQVQRPSESAGGSFSL